jgi:imidazolonepropionase-like amidohydrolase
MLRKSVLALAVCLLSILAFAQTQPPAAPAPKPVLVKAARLLDVNTGQYKTGQAVLIEGERIKAVGPAAELAAQAPGADVIDLGDATLLPGLIDCHTHLGGRADQYEDIEPFKRTPFTSAFAGVVNARKTLDAGFTTVRDVGSMPFLAVDLRNTINEGFIPGPRIVASGPGISITGGHGDLNSFSPETSVTLFPAERNYQIADGVDQVIHVVRAQEKYGVDVIKILASGGVLSRGDQPGAPQFSLAELKAAADTAHQGGRKIAAHAHGAQSIKDSIHAGIDSIEHASLVDDDGIRMAKEHGTYFVMDIYNDDYILHEAAKFGLSKEKLDKERALGQTQRDNFRKAWKAGVKMAFGTDAGVYPHGDNARQFHYMVLYGMTPAEAIRAATASAADLITNMGKTPEVGSIEAGKYADMIAVTGDPLAKVETLEHVAWVMKGGRVYKDELHSSR